MLRATVSAFMAFFIFLVAHALDFHFFFPQEKVNSLLWTALFGLFCFAFFSFILPTEEWFQSKLHISHNVMKRLIFPLLGVLFYAFLFLGYLEFYFTADRSITFRMLMIIDKEPNCSITSKNMFTRYDVPGIINKRFEDLTYGGYLVRQGDTYHLTNKGTVALNVYRFAIGYLHLGNAEQTK